MGMVWVWNWTACWGEAVSLAIRCGFLLAAFIVKACHTGDEAEAAKKSIGQVSYYTEVTGRLALVLALFVATIIMINTGVSLFLVVRV
jgi:hypothetical protein